VSPLLALVISRLSRVLRRSMPLLTALSVVLLGTRPAAGQNPVTITAYSGPTYVGQTFITTYYYDEENYGGYYVNTYRLAYTIRNNTTSNQYAWYSLQCTALCSNASGVVSSILAPNQTAQFYVYFNGPESGSVSATVTLSTTRANYNTCWSEWIEEDYDCQFSAGGSYDSMSLSVTATSTTATASPGIAAYRPTVTPKTTTETIPFASAMSRSFTIQNSGSQTATYSITASCGTMTGCSPSKTTTTLAPSATDNVDVSFTSPANVNTTNTIKLIATYTNAGGQTVADTGTRPTVTPSQRPTVSPHTGMTAATPGGSNSYTFNVAINGGYGSNATLTAVCAGWITGCAVADVWDNENEGFTVVSVSYGAPAALGGATYPTASLKLIAQVGVAADTGVLTVALGYYKPTVTPKTTTISESANTSRTYNATVTNTGNLATGYSITMVCAGVTNCTPYQTYLYLNPGQASSINGGYTAPAIGQTGTVKVIATHAGYPNASLTEADTAVINTTGADIVAPTMTFGVGLPAEGQTVIGGALSFTLNACDLDGQLQTPTISANGVSVTPSFTSGSSASCSTTKAATVSFVAVPGANTINFSVSDGSHTTSVVRHFTYNESYEARPIVTALVSSHMLRAGQQWADTFSVRNAGPLTVLYSLSAGCAGGFSACTASSSSISVGPNQTVKMAVNFTTSANPVGTVWPIVTYTPVSGAPTTVNDVYTMILVDYIAPTAVITGPAPNATISAFPNLSVAWCDPDGQLAVHTLAVDGTPLTDTFTSQTVSGCTSAGTSSWSNVALTLGAHTLTATAADAAGNVTTSTLSFTLSLPAIASFQPDVTPRTATPSLIPSSQTLAWAVRNVGTLSAVYQMTADCTGIATVSGCQLDKTSVTLAAGAVDSVHTTYQVSSWPTTPPTVKLSAKYTDIVGRVVADTASVSLVVPSVAALFQPQLPSGGGTRFVQPNVITGFTVAVTNTGVAPVTYHMDLSVAAPFSIHETFVNDTLTVQPGQIAQYFVQVRSPIDNGVSGQLTVSASYTFSGQTVSATMMTNITTRATTPAILMATRGGTNQASPGSGSITVDLINIGVGTLQGQLDTPPHCTAIITNCRFAPRAEGTTISLAASASTPITVFYDMLPPSQGSGDGGLVEIIFNGQSGTASAGIYRTGGANITRQVVAEWVSVTPDNLPVRYNPGQADQTYAFEIRNAGTVDARFDYTVSCAGAGGPGSPSSVTCAAQPGQTRLLAHDSVETVVVHFATTMVDSTGFVTLTATKVGNSSIHDAGSIAVRLNVTIADIAVSAATVNSDSVIARNQCVTIAAGSDAAYECGDLRIVHPLPATTTMNKTRAPVLIYNSAHATGHAIVAANVRIKEGISPNRVIATLTLQRNSATDLITVTRPINWDPAWSDARWHRVAVQFDAANVSLISNGNQAGLFKYMFEVKSENDAALVSRDSGVMVVVDRSGSKFGKGWWLDGLEQIIMLPDTAKRLWIGGDGSARVYTWLSNNVWTVRPALDRVDSLTFSTSTSTYRRRLSNGAYVEFEVNGKHIATVNQYGHKTQFVQDALGLRTIKLPVVSGTPPQYQFDYDNTSTAPRVRWITPPRSSRQVTLDYASSSSRDLAAILGPTADSVRFTQNGTGLIDARYDRLQHRTGFAYDSARLVREVTIDNQPENVVSTFCPAESASLTACAQAGILSDSVRTSFNGPRTDVPDVTQFYVTRYGAPRLIINAIGERTTIDRTDTLWRLLPTALTQPNGHKVVTQYSTDRGLPVRMLDIGPLTANDTAITKYSWHARWDEVTGVTSPMGVIDTMAFSADTAFRLWQQRGTNSSRRVYFNYDANTRLVSSTTVPLMNRDSIEYSPSTGNVIGIRARSGALDNDSS
jgi:hypothetical protein